MARMAWSGTRSCHQRRAARQTRIRSAGPAANADARKRGARIGGEPERPAGQAVVEERGHGVDADRPRDGEHDHRREPAGRCDAVPLGVQRDAGDDDVQDEVAAEREHVPEHHRPRRRVAEHVQHARRLAHVHEDEGHAHHDRGDREELAEDRHAPERLVVVQVVRQHHHHGRRGHADEERELRDVEPPGDVAAHAGDAEAGAQLLRVGPGAEAGHRREGGHPRPVAARTVQCLFEHNPSPEHSACDVRPIGADQPVRPKPRAASRKPLRRSSTPAAASPAPAFRRIEYRSLRRPANLGRRVGDVAEQHRLRRARLDARRRLARSPGAPRTGCTSRPRRACGSGSRTAAARRAAAGRSS